MITARRLCQVEDLGLALVAGTQAADRPIAWAHAIELADPTPYLAGGELVMTTGINIGPDAAAQAAYVARLADAGTAALAVDTGTTLSAVPAGVLTAGDEHGVPILRVPAATPFIAISRVVIDAVKADQLRSVQRVVDQQEVLTRATLRGGIPGWSRRWPTAWMRWWWPSPPTAASSPRAERQTATSSRRCRRRPGGARTRRGGHTRR